MPYFLSAQMQAVFSHLVQYNIIKCRQVTKVLMNSNEYITVVDTIKKEIQSAQYRTAVQANTELLRLYYSIGKEINVHKIWGNKFIENLSMDIRADYPTNKGFSVRNLKYMAKFAATYSEQEFVQQAVAQIPWGHNIVLLDKSLIMSSAVGMRRLAKRTAGHGMFLFIK